MEIGFIGLGRMGSGMVNRLLKDRHRVVVWNRSSGPMNESAKQGAIKSKNIEDLVSNLKARRKVVWIMLPAGEITELYIKSLSRCLRRGDIIIDGGNSNFHDSIRRHEELKKIEINFLDVGTSGGVNGEKEGYCMMAGGSRKVYDSLKPMFKSLCVKDGFEHIGKNGSGHYIKMVHNAIEYGMMQSIAEGFDLMNNSGFNLNLKKIAKLWNHGSIVSSYLMKMTGNALSKNMNNIEAYVEDSGEGKFASIDALEKRVPFTANSYALNSRYISRDKNSFAFRLLSSIRNQFGGHKIKKK